MGAQGQEAEPWAGAWCQPGNRFKERFTAQLPARLGNFMQETGGFFYGEDKYLHISGTVGFSPSPPIKNQLTTQTIYTENHQWTSPIHSHKLHSQHFIESNFKFKHSKDHRTYDEASNLKDRNQNATPNRNSEELEANDGF